MVCGSEIKPLCNTYGSLSLIHTLTLNSAQEISVEEFTLRKTCPLNIICEIKKKKVSRDLALRKLTAVLRKAED